MEKNGHGRIKSHAWNYLFSYDRHAPDPPPAEIKCLCYQIVPRPLISMFNIDYASVAEFASCIK